MSATLGRMGKYELLEEVGRGAFGTVYRAIDTDLEVERAVKVLDPLLARDDAFRSLFFNEAKAAAKLKHPNIVNIYDVGQTPEGIFIAMELLPGQNLSRLIKSRGPLSLATIVKVIWQIASALDFAHNQGLVHRDVKSANVIVSDANHATLTDFGLVKALRESVYLSDPGRSAARQVGSIAYMAPESIQRGEFTPKSDLYSLAVVLYEMVTGRWPFLGTEYEIQRGHLELMPPAPTALRSGLPPAVESVVLQALAKSPQYRFNDCAHLAHTLWWVVQPQQKRTQASPPLPAPRIPAQVTQRKRLHRSRRNHKLAGVCGGLAERLGQDPTTVRLIFVLGPLLLACPTGGLALLVYLLYPILAMSMPLAPEDADGG